MTNIRKLVHAALEKHMKVPVARLRYTGTARRYVVWRLLGRRYTSYYDDEGEGIETTVQVELCASDAAPLDSEESQLIAALGSLGFDCINQGDDYITDTQTERRLYLFMLTEDEEDDE